MAYRAKADASSVELQYHHHDATPIEWDGAAKQGPEPKLKG
jgi:hypothetical protein